MRALWWHRPSSSNNVSQNFKRMRAKGTLISEPRFSTPCDMRFFPCDTGKMAFLEGLFLENGLVPVSHGKNRMSQGVEHRVSLISVPLTLRVF